MSKISATILQKILERLMLPLGVRFYGDSSIAFLSLTLWFSTHAKVLKLGLLSIVLLRLIDQQICLTRDKI